MDKPWWYDQQKDVPWSSRRKKDGAKNMTQCERCLFYVANWRLEEHKKVCDSMTKKELRKLLKND